jgi:hypothetical protein
LRTTDSPYYWPKLTPTAFRGFHPRLQLLVVSPMPLPLQGDFSNRSCLPKKQWERCLVATEFGSEWPPVLIRFSVAHTIGWQTARVRKGSIGNFPSRPNPLRAITAQTFLKATALARRSSGLKIPSLPREPRICGEQHLNKWQSTKLHPTDFSAIHGYLNAICRHHSAPRTS